MGQRYNHRVKIGNWYDETVLQDEIKEKFLTNKRANKLKFQKSRKLCEDMLKDVSLSLLDRCVTFGSVLQIVAPDVDLPNFVDEMTSDNTGVSLAANVSFTEVEKRQHFEEGDQVVATQMLKPCVRNTWSLLPYSDAQHVGEVVCFGDSFLIGLSGASLYVDLAVPHPSSPKGKCGRVVPYLTLDITNNARFRAAHIDPSCTYEAQGRPIAVGEAVALLHAPDGHALAVEPKHFVVGYLGPDCEVSKHSILTQRKTHAAVNVWSFVARTK